MGRIESSTAQMYIRFPAFLSSFASAYDWQKMSGLNAKGLKKTEEKDDDIEEEGEEGGGKENEV